MLTITELNIYSSRYGLRKEGSYLVIQCPAGCSVEPSRVEDVASRRAVMLSLRNSLKQRSFFVASFAPRLFRSKALSLAKPRNCSPRPNRVAVFCAHPASLWLALWNRFLASLSTSVFSHLYFALLDLDYGTWDSQIESLWASGFQLRFEHREFAL